ncbi:MAG: TIR domain-containing protein, partial [Acidobacteria bacterium]|nr:TIR domain-containing protein [Acidobacteriota bacterium]
MSSPIETNSDDIAFTIDAFVTYASQDIRFAQRLKEAVEAQGKRLIMDLSVATPDTPNLVQATSDIDRADNFIFIISPESVASPLCMRQLSIARRVGKPIIALFRSTVDAKPKELSLAYTIDFTREEKFDEAVRELVEALDRASASQPQPSGDALNISLQQPSSTRTVDYAASPALAYLLAKATRINHALGQEFDLSFSSMLLAFLASDDLLSRWFSRYVKDADIAIDELLKARTLDRATLERIASDPFSEMELSKLDYPRVRTESAQRLFDAARELSNSYNSVEDKYPVTVVDVRHLMAAYIYRPAGHEQDLEGLHFNRQAWSNAFLGQIQKLYPLELAWWKDLHQRTFNEEAMPVEEIEGPSTHIASDMWTLNDTLGYRAYAHAIYRFMTHPQTRPPLTISIQAPWGGGKTSLMRMIQHALDPDAVKEVEEEGEQPRGDLTIKDALAEIDKWIMTRTQEALPSVPEDKDRKLLTVWFNAWKYESVNQVWAGLVDAIMQQVAARLPLIERELFWLRLNLKRVDADK